MAAISVRYLRDLPDSACFFNPKDSSISKFSALNIYDRTADGTNSRKLPENEMLVMALNELAADHQQGYFFFLPNRDRATRQKVLPESRAPPKDAYGASYPELVYIQHIWNDASRDQFHKQPHRTRYMLSDFLCNPPHAATPVYCFQVAARANAQIFATPTESSIILQSDQRLYFIPTSVYEGIARRKTRHSSKRVDARLQLNSIPAVWDSNGKCQELLQLAPYAHGNVQELYLAIVHACRGSETQPTGTVSDVWQALPRPTLPEKGMPLGSLQNDDDVRDNVA